MTKTANRFMLAVIPASALIATQASAQDAAPVSYSSKLNSLVTDNAAILAILAGIVVAVAGFALFKRLSNKA